MHTQSYGKILVIALLSILIGACASTSSKVVETPKVETYNTTYNGPKNKLAVGKFVNRSSFQNGIFSTGVDRLGNQAKTTLMSHLQQTNRFTVLDRDNMEMLAVESAINNASQNLSGAKYVVTGDVTEFGRKDVGDKQLFGLLGKGKSQIAYAKVTINIVDVNTSEMVYTSSGAGEYSLSEREVIGFGSTAGYDSTLNGKVLDLAIREAVNNLVEGLESGAWSVQPELNTTKPQVWSI
uniref:CsgG/HfaB family protein n=1 Tax=Ningiella ruwaisensis TaxID=2364274 RepID=UPI00109F449F|nr:CsgG/HfaB family protein [Ningiella ruwaisensis]